MTEKFFEPLVAGSVPVYLGAPNVEDFAPGRSCYIDATRYASPAELADHLSARAMDERAYAALHAWRSEPLSESFAAKLARVKFGSFHRLARLLRPLPPIQ